MQEGVFEHSTAYRDAAYYYSVLIQGYSGMVLASVNR